MRLFIDKLQEKVAEHTAVVILTPLVALAIVVGKEIGQPVLDAMLTSISKTTLLLLLGLFGLGILGLCSYCFCLRNEIKRMKIAPPAKDITEDYEFDQRFGLYIDKATRSQFVCTACLNISNKAIPVALNASQIDYVCSVCKGQYANPNYQPPTPRWGGSY